MDTIPDKETFTSAMVRLSQERAEPPELDGDAWWEFYVAISELRQEEIGILEAQLDALREWSEERDVPIPLIDHTLNCVRYWAELDAQFAQESGEPDICGTARDAARIALSRLPELTPPPEIEEES